MRKVLTLFIAVCLVASSLPGCILTPIHPERRQVTNWDLELVKMEGVQDVPVTIVRGISNRVGDRDPKNWRIPSALAAARRRALEILERPEWERPE